MYDRKCPRCALVQLDRLEPVEAPAVPCPGCGYEQTERVWITKPPAAIGDECDVEIKHGLCNPDGTPRRFTSKAEMARYAKERGMTNYVEHRGTKGGDKSKFTSRWV